MIVFINVHSMHLYMHVVIPTCIYACMLLDYNLLYSTDHKQINAHSHLTCESVVSARVVNATLASSV